MKGLLLYPLNKSNPEFIGLHKKMLSQKRAFQMHGDMDIINFDDHGIYLNDEMIIPFGKGRMHYWVGCYIKLYSHIIQFIKPASYDFIYIRYPLATPFFVSFLRRWKKKAPRVPVYVEIPTFPYRNETGTFLRKILMMTDKLFFSSVVRYSTKFVFHNYPDESLRLNFYFMGNGVERSGMLNFVDQNDFILTGIANLSNYHGYDRIINGMNTYYNSGRGKRKTVIFKIIGDGQERKELEKLTRRLGLDDYVHFLGTLQGKELDEQLSVTSLGISTLAWHRVGVSNDGSLKSREYCIKGIPFVTCAGDKDFPEDMVGRLNVGLTDDAVEMERLLGFYQNLPSNTSVKMHQFALENLTWEGKINRFMQCEINHQ